jgi:hypothetical protein
MGKDDVRKGSRRMGGGGFIYMLVHELLSFVRSLLVTCHPSLSVVVIVV